MITLRRPAAAAAGDGQVSSPPLSSPSRRRAGAPPPAVTFSDHRFPSAKPRRRSKNRAAAAATATAVASMVLMGCASPRNTRRARRRLEKEIVSREERPSEIFEHEAVKVRKRRQTKLGTSREEKPSLAPHEPPPSPSPGDVEDTIGHVVLDGLKETISELIMWKNFAKSSLWFGLGRSASHLLVFPEISTSGMKIISSSRRRDCVVSAVSHLGLVLLAVAFIRDSVPRRNEEKARRILRVKEEDILRATRLVLPVINAVIATIQDIFSGQPTMTLRVAPVLLFTAKYGHCITLWRLLAAGFFIGFTVPKLYFTYTTQIHRHAASMGNCVLEGWEACRRKRVLGVSAAMTLWNLLSVKTRVIAAFACLVVLRYHRQRLLSEKEEEEGLAGGGEIRRWRRLWGPTRPSDLALNSYDERV
ncbi:unnamed protein product [Spirodela intermedia]|uniref:Reticulon domain-containing protein n=1 Tax=Spirodela intermedia TaxID=51605 RepID=A0A7I8J697_SPIIN|nr:unnamed protein product [Spirodela intermedia]CAA6665777.1 unnamed protein product [Spirodela intermedia]